MKKILALTLAALLLAGCGAAGVKTGVGSVISVAKSKNATADAQGLAQADVTMAAVTFDSAGKIVSVDIDVAQVKVEFDQNGVITTDIAAVQKSKVELGDSYGMKKASNIGKEWYEQIADLEKWMVGKTVDQVKSMKTKDGAPDETDLTSKVTITVSDYQEAVAKAFANANK
jgi:hypothetical protein